MAGRYRGPYVDFVFWVVITILLIDEALVGANKVVSKRNSSPSITRYKGTKANGVEIHAAQSFHMQGDRDNAQSLASPSLFSITLRGLYLWLTFVPMLVSAIPAFWSELWREHVWYPIVSWTLARGGAAWIKWAQWASTRPDVFPESLCMHLATLQTDAPAHSYQHTLKEVEEAFGSPLESVFSYFDSSPVASGSIAQVHMATFEGESVAVKVRHPGVARQISIDFRIMAFLGDLAGRLPLLKYLNLKASVEAFSHTMTGQTFLDIEGNHLALFNRNFAQWGDVGFPQPLVSSEGVLVESFAEGRLVSDFTAPDPHLKEGKTSDLDVAKNPRLPLAIAHFIVTRGEDLYLKMLLEDGLMHADLHPGNILVSFDPTQQHPRRGNARIVLVDAGMVALLSIDEQKNFIGLLECMVTGDGAEAAEHVLNFSTDQTCVDRAAFIEAMQLLFEKDCRGVGQGISLARVLRGVLKLVRENAVRIDVNYATLVMNALCLDGLANALLPSYNVLDAAAPLLLTHRRWAGAGRRGGRWLMKQFLKISRWRKERHDAAVGRKVSSLGQEGRIRGRRRLDSHQAKWLL